MEFCKMCPQCKKTYNNGAIGRCGMCQVDLIEIEFSNMDEKKARDGTKIFCFYYREKMK